jgi:hypothetical protein
MDPKTYLFFILGVVENIPNNGTSNFDTLIIKSFGFSILVTTLMQTPYGTIIALSIPPRGVNDYAATRMKTNTRCHFILLFLCPNTVGTFRVAVRGDESSRSKMNVVSIAEGIPKLEKEEANN